VSVVDPSVPNVARIYDFMLGGKDHYVADREAAAKLLKMMPGSAKACRQNRAFLGRMVSFLARGGIEQFIDLGSGLPTAENTHEIAQDVNPQARVVYVDNDPVAVVHTRALLEKGSKGVFTLEADLRDPATITSDPQVRELIDFGQPAAILAFAVLHFVTDAERPGEIIAHFTQAMASGSYLALSHLTDEAVPAETSLAAQEVYQKATAPVVPRSREQITRFFDGMGLVKPGVTDINRWPARQARRTAPLVFYGGTARKP
jgi:hypothetical protein